MTRPNAKSRSSSPGRFARFERFGHGNLRIRSGTALHVPLRMVQLEAPTNKDRHAIPASFLRSFDFADAGLGSNLSAPVRFCA